MLVKRYWLFSIFFGLVLAQTQDSMAMRMQSGANISPDLLSLRKKFLAQGEQAEAIILSYNENLIETSRYIPENVIIGLNRFFEDPRAQRLFVDRYKRPMIAGTVQGRMQRDGGMRSKLLQENESCYMQQHKKYQISTAESSLLLSQIAGEYGLTDISQDGNTFALTSPFWAGYVVKIAKYRWIDNDAMLAFPYQLISRVFYNQELNSFITSNGYDQHILCFVKSLYHIPGTPDDITDDNYVVVEPLHACPSKLENGRRFREITAKELIEGHGEYACIKTEYFDAVCELIMVIQHCGLWSISLSNVFLLDNRKIAIVDTERPGLGGGEWRFFFHQGEGSAAEVDRNASCGFDGLITDVLRTKPQ
jgi:hypothetical protein